MATKKRQYKVALYKGTQILETVIWATTPANAAHAAVRANKGFHFHSVEEW